MADYSELKRKAQEIRNEVKAGGNTANRVGLALEETVNALEATNEEVSKKQDKLNNYIERPSNGEVVIFEREKVSLEVDDHENIATVGTYIDSTDRIVPIARIKSTYDSGDYACVETRGNEVNIYGDYVNVNGFDLIQTIRNLETRIVTLEARLTNTTEEQ